MNNSLNTLLSTVDRLAGRFTLIDNMVDAVLAKVAPNIEANAAVSSAWEARGTSCWAVTSCGNNRCVNWFWTGTVCFGQCTSTSCTTQGQCGSPRTC